MGRSESPDDYSSKKVARKVFLITMAGTLLYLLAVFVFVL